MEVSAKSIKCPNCGANLSMTDKQCMYCKSPVVISTFSSVDKMPLPLLNKYVSSYRERISTDGNDSAAQFSIGLCFLKLKLYPQAKQAIDKAMQLIFDSADLYFYAAVIELAGKKPYLNKRPQIDAALSYLDAAFSLDMRPVFKFFEAYIRYDYFYRNYLNASPNFGECLEMANALGGVSEADKQELFRLLNVPAPDWRR